MKNLSIIFILAALLTSACGGHVGPDADVAECDNKNSFTPCEKIITVNIEGDVIQVTDVVGGEVD